MTIGNDRFLKCKNGQTLPNSVFTYKINSLRNNPSIEYFCIVEGKSDETFYNNTTISYLNSDKTRYIFSEYSENSNDLAGKSAVVQAFKDYKRKFPYLMNRCIFIVDHDWDGLDYKKYKLSKQDFEGITVTPCYSYENYFLYENNIECIFDYLFGEQNCKVNFKNDLMLFSQELSEYYALKNTYSRCYSEDALRRFLIKRNEFCNEESIIILNFKENTLIDKSILNQEIKTIRSMIAWNNITIYYYNTYLNAIRNDIMCLKGKILFRFLKQYLLQKSRKDIGPRNISLYSKLVSKLNIDLDVRFGNGKRKPDVEIKNDL